MMKRGVPDRAPRRNAGTDAILMDKRRDNRVRRGLAAYVAMIGLVGIVAGIVGWRLLQEDRALQRQQIDDRLETSADALALELRTVVAAMRASLTEFALSEPNPSAPATRWVEDLPGDSLVALFDDDSVRAWPRDRLLFRPIPEDHGPGLQSFYTEGEVLEFREANPLAAAAFFAELGESEDAGVRAGALVRLARNLRKLGRHQEALDAYDRLFDCGEAYVDGRPAELLARQGRLAESPGIPKTSVGTHAPPRAALLAAVASLSPSTDPRP